jgi:hypothetical protein
MEGEDRPQDPLEVGTNVEARPAAQTRSGSADPQILHILSRD